MKDILNAMREPIAPGDRAFWVLIAIVFAGLFMDSHLMWIGVIITLFTVVRLAMERDNEREI